MDNLEIFRLARTVFEESMAVEQVFRRLPKGVTVSLLLDNRFEAHLAHDGSSTKFVEGPSKVSDFELTMSSEALRRMSVNPPGSLGDLAKEFIAQGLRRDIKWRLLISPKSLLDKGYLQSMKDLGPLIQGEAAQSLMVHAGKALSAFEDLKAKFRPKS